MSVDARVSLAKCLGLLKFHHLAYKVLKDGILLFDGSRESLRFVQPIANNLLTLKDKFVSDEAVLNKFVRLLEESLPQMMKGLIMKSPRLTVNFSFNSLASQT